MAGTQKIQGMRTEQYGVATYAEILSQTYSDKGHKQLKTPTNTTGFTNDIPGTFPDEKKQGNVNAQRQQTVRKQNMDTSADPPTVETEMLLTQKMKKLEDQYKSILAMQKQMRVH